MNALRRRFSGKSGEPQRQTPQAASPQASPPAVSSTPAVLPLPTTTPPETTPPKASDRKFRTKTHRCTLAPQFDQTFVAEGVLGSFLSGPLHVKVLDYDAVSFDDSLGTLELSLQALREQDQIEHTKRNLSGVAHGTLSLVVSWAADDPSAAGGAPRDEQSGSLSILVVEAAELIAADSNGLSDPYVVLQLAGGTASSGGLGDVRERLGDLRGDVVEATQRAKQSLEDKLGSVAAAIKPKGLPQVPMERVNAPTPEALWFTPREGWPVFPTHSTTTMATPTVREPAPPLLMPTAAEAAALYEHEEDALGELRVEVLQAEGLKGKAGNLSLMGAASDPYALLMVEGFAARTSTVADNDAPRWACDTHRAFRFPLRRPYGTLFIGLMDDDSHEGVGSEQLNRLISDDGLARVRVPLGPLVPGTVYDGWYFLQYENVLRHAGARGALRLRISVRYTSERARLLAYVLPPADVAPPGAATVVPFTSRRLWRSAQLAAHGKKALHVYDEEVLKAYIVELSGLLDETLEQLGAVRDLIFWKTPLLSCLAMLQLQLLVSYPVLLPAALALTPVFFLHRNLMQCEEVGPICAQPSVASLFCSLVLGTRPRPLTVEPAPCEASEWMYVSSDGHSSEEESEEQKDKRWSLGKKQRRHAHHAGWLEVLGAGASRKGILDSPLLGGGSEGALHDERLRLLQQATQRGEKAAAAAADALEGRKAAFAKGHFGALTSGDLGKLGTGVVASLNPLAGVLGGVQPILGQALRGLRSTKRMLTWTDRALTLWLLLGCCALSSLLALLGLLVPWGPVLRWGARLAGALLLGPHMLFVGRWLERRAAAAAAKEEAYRSADEAGRRAMLKAVGDEVGAEVDAADAARASALAKRPAWIVAKEAALRENKYNMLLQLPMAPASKFIAVMDPQRSRATPLGAAE